jgi:hypothetical protein
MKKAIISLIALAALTGGAFAGDDGSNGYAGHNATDAIIVATPSNTIISKAAVVYTVKTMKSARLGDEAGNGYASHNIQ